MAEDWRIAIELESRPHARAFHQACTTALSAPAEASRAGAIVYVYASNQNGALGAWELVLRTVEQEDVTADLSLERWNPVTKAWQPANLPMPSVREPPAPLAMDFRQARWQLRITAESPEQADRVEEALWAHGYGTGRIGRCEIAFVGETEAHAQRAAMHARRAAAGAEIDVRPLTWLSRIWIDLRVYGLGE